MQRFNYNPRLEWLSGKVHPDGVIMANGPVTIEIMRAIDGVSVETRTEDPRVFCRQFQCGPRLLQGARIPIARRVARSPFRPDSPEILARVPPEGRTEVELEGHVGLQPSDQTGDVVRPGEGRGQYPHRVVYCRAQRGVSADGL